MGVCIMIKNLSSREFIEFKKLALLKSLDSNHINFNNMAKYVLSNIPININSLINNNSLPSANHLLIDKLTVLLKEILKGREELKKTFYGLLEEVKTTDIPKSAKLSVMLKIFIDSKNSKVLFRHKRLLAAIDCISDLRAKIDYYNLDINDILIQDLIKQNNEYICIESYGEWGAAAVVKYDITQDKYIELFINLSHEKTKSIIYA